ncbi:MAG: hypothetical protein JNM17_15240 [Archangium sp.]|nr:hypothetical protein [Archangium sp.]
MDQLLDQLAPGDQEVRSRIRLAQTNPTQYAKKFRERLEARNAEDEPIDFWLQLVDALDQHGWSWSVDWKASADDVMHALTKVLTKKKLHAKWLTAPYDPGAHLHERTDQLLAWCGRALSAHGLAVIAFDISSDSFELSVVRTSELSALQKAAKQLGGGIDSFAPKRPLTVPLPSATREAPKKFESVQTPQLWMGRDDYFRVPGITIESANGTTLCDLRTWPPKKRALGAAKLSYTSSPRGHEVAHNIVRLYRDGAWTEPATGTVRASLRGEKPVELISAIPRGFDTDHAYFVSDLLVLFPTEPTVRGGLTRRPLVWSGGKKLAPARGLPDARAKKGTRRERFPSFLRTGIVELGNGEDLLVWEGRLWERHGPGFRALKTPKRFEVDTFFFFQTAPGPKGTRSFVHVTAKNEVVLTSLDDGTSRVLAKSAETLHAPRAAGERGVLLRVGRSGNAKAPLLRLAHFDGRPMTDIAASAFGVRTDDTVEAHGVTGDWLWVAHQKAIKRLPLFAFG